ncbi:CDP-diacylglycerol--glycerol-3-phosphate 3-phosphatidyltransferase [Datura stramonium]|uniref:CDP-diacylglycerol--glycerol-3-phosphate 3-phosphatidyltransferase n=1 Tax=Datura stramonium TaxID=4076 RepID=A0ABS8SGE0_DATST|nr:CDP-diacylglycerol--glycerol-3-phosphate 3-phosphatidyltransferase [Datura stramonium]
MRNYSPMLWLGFKLLLLVQYTWASTRCRIIELIAYKFASLDMKIVRRDFVPDGPGSVKIVPEEADDLWVAYNLIAEGDTVLAVTVRKVLREAASGGRDAERVKLKLEIKVENIEYDKEGSALRIRGKNILENEHVKIGAFHT